MATPDGEAEGIAIAREIVRLHDRILFTEPSPGLMQAIEAVRERIREAFAMTTAEQRGRSDRVPETARPRPTVLAPRNRALPVYRPE